MPKDTGRTRKNPSDSGTYLVESIEYVSATDLPPNDLFADPTALTALLDYTRSSIRDRAATPERRAPTPEGQGRTPEGRGRMPAGREGRSGPSPRS